jgi:hypothetical protein
MHMHIPGSLHCRIHHYHTPYIYEEMSNLVKAYENLLLDNVSTVRSVESGLRNLTWLLPGRFADADVASEGRMFPHLAK